MQKVMSSSEAKVAASAIYEALNITSAIEERGDGGSIVRITVDSRKRTPSERAFIRKVLEGVS